MREGKYQRGETVEDTNQLLKNVRKVRTREKQIGLDAEE